MAVDKSQLVLGIHLLIGAFLVGLGVLFLSAGALVQGGINVAMGVAVGIVGYRVSNTL
jgi:hypothetical protein